MYRAGGSIGVFGLLENVHPPPSIGLIISSWKVGWMFHVEICIIRYGGTDLLL